MIRIWIKYLGIVKEMLVKIFTGLNVLHILPFKFRKSTFGHNANFFLIIFFGKLVLSQDLTILLVEI